MKTTAAIACSKAVTPSTMAMSLWNFMPMKNQGTVLAKASA